MYVCWILAENEIINRVMALLGPYTQPNRRRISPRLKTYGQWEADINAQYNLDLIMTVFYSSVYAGIGVQVSPSLLIRRKRGERMISEKIKRGRTANRKRIMEAAFTTSKLIMPSVNLW